MRDAGVARGASGDKDFRMMALRVTRAERYRRVTAGAAWAGIAAASGAPDSPAGSPGRRPGNDGALKRTGKIQENGTRKGEQQAVVRIGSGRLSEPHHEETQRRTRSRYD